MSQTELPENNGLILMPPHNAQRVLMTAALGLCALSVIGCAGVGCPRIDPSGERIFIWPRNQVAAVAPSTANVQAQPVFTDPVFPQPAIPGQAQIASVAGQQVPGLIPPLPQDRLSLSPDRVLAPVGSEVILKAGLCTRDNYLLTDSKIEWLLARDEVGEFVSLGGRGWCKDPWLPWNKPKKIDNQYATGYTARVPLQITRGTADPTDDVQVEPGEAWASITSPVEGTSRITAVAPEIETWANRRATATIYWVDVQWTFPAATVTGGGSQVLTTTVRRQTDGTPIEGWLVRYEVADGGGSLRGNESGQVVEVPTDAEGRASIDVTPTGSAGSTTRINTQVVRPARFADSNAPRLVIANGATTVNWTDAGSDYLPPPDNLDGPTPSYPLPGEGSVVPPTPAPPINRRGPVLDLKVFTDDSEVQVGSQARFRVEIDNNGDAPATGIVLSDNYDEGLAHVSDPQRLMRLEKSLGDLAAGESYSEFLTFDVRQAGQLCQDFTVTYNGGSSAQKRACIQASQPLVLPQGQLEVTKQGPRQRKVGEEALFTLSVKNVGQAPLTNIEIEDEYDRALLPQPVQPGARLLNGRLIWSLPRLAIGESKRFDVKCQCVAPNRNACSTASVTAETGTSAGVLSKADQACIEILPSADVVPGTSPVPGGNVMPGVVPPAGADVVPANPGATGPLDMQILLFANPVRAGTQTTFQIVIGNNGTTSDQQVQLRVNFPAELTPDVTAIRTDARVQAQFNNGILQFAPIAELRAGERVEFAIPCNVNQQGLRDLTAQLISRNMPQGLQKTKKVEILGR